MTNTLKTEVIAVGGILLAVVQTDQGHTVQFRGKRGATREVVIDRRWAVYYAEPDPEFTENAYVASADTIGMIEYRMATRETRTEGRRYVSERWQSPAWFLYFPYSGRGWEQPTKKAALERIVEDYKRTHGPKEES